MYMTRRSGAAAARTVTAGATERCGGNELLRAGKRGVLEDICKPHDLSEAPGCSGKRRRLRLVVDYMRLSQLVSPLSMAHVSAFPIC